MKNIKKIVIGFSTIAIFGLAACDNSSIGDDRQSVNTSAKKNLNTDEQPQLDISSLQATALKDANYVFDIKNTLIDQMDPDVVDAFPETIIKIRLTTDIGSDEGIILLEEKYEDLEAALPAESLFSPEYFKQHSKDHANNLQRIRVILTREDIKSAIIQDLENSKAITSEQASELSVLFNVTEERFYEINPTLVITATDILETEGIEESESYRLEILELQTKERTQEDEHPVDITSFTSVEYDIVSDEVLEKTIEPKGQPQSSDNDKLAKQEPTSETINSNTIIKPMNFDRILVENQKNLDAIIAEKEQNRKEEQEKKSARTGTVIIEDIEPEVTPNFSKGDL